MGSSGYSGKGSYSYSSPSYVEPVRKPRTAMDDMLDLLTDVESQRKRVAARRDDVTDAQTKLAQEEANLQRAEDKVMQQLERLDPETRETLRSMMRGLNRRNGNVIGRDDR